MMFASKLEHHGLFIVAQFFEESLHVFFEKRWSAEYDESLGAWGWHALLQHFFCYEADALRPVVLHVWLDIDRERELELVGMVFLQLLELVFQEDVVDGPVAKQQGHIGRIIVQKNCLDYLVAWRDASTASDAANLRFSGHINFCNHKVALAFVSEAAFWAFHLQLVADLQSVNILAHHAALWELGVNVRAVDLDEEVDEAAIRQRTNRRVLSLNLLTLRMLCCRSRGGEYDVLPNWQAKRHILVREAEAVYEGVLRDFDALDQLEPALPLLITILLKSTAVIWDQEVGLWVDGALPGPVLCFLPKK